MDRRPGDVDECVEDELADNSDDEKRLFRAEARKLKKAQAAKLKKRKSGPSRKPQLGLDPGTAASLSTGAQHGRHGLRLIELPTLPTSPWALVSCVESLGILESLAHCCKALVQLVDV